MRRRTVVAALLVVLAVLLGGSWFGFSGREGLTPVEPASTGADDIDELYLFMSALAVAILLSVIVPLALIIGRYRERGLPRDVEGPQIRGNTRLELAWTAIPLVIVLVISGVALWKALDIRDPKAAAAGEAELEVRVEGRLFYWRYVYPNGAIAIDTLRLPVDRVAELDVTAPENDVIHSFWVPALGGKVDAIPGEIHRLKIRPTRTGTFQGKCAELCGIQHGAMTLTAEVLPAAEFDRWLEQTAATQEAGESDLGATLFNGVCAKCHFAAPEYAPNLAGNPLLRDPQAVRQVILNGRGRMPSVARGWTERELEALTSFVRTLAGGESNGG